MSYDIRFEIKPGYLFANLEDATRWIGEQMDDSDNKKLFMPAPDNDPQFGA